MRKLLITLDDNLDPWLKRFPNQNEVVRKALAVYKEDITTDVVAGLRKAFRELKENQDRTNELLEKLVARIPEF